MVQCKVSTTAPKGDTFFVLIQWVGVAEGTQRTRVRITVDIEFVKSVGFLKGAIQGGAVGGTKSGTQALVSVGYELGHQCSRIRDRDIHTSHTIRQRLTSSSRT